MMKVVTLFNSRGEAAAYLAYPHLYNMNGEWIGFSTNEREVYSVLGRYVGYVTDERRVVRERTLSSPKPIREAPPPPRRLNPPATIPLAPMMSELTHSTIDVLLEEPNRLHTIDMGELRQDLD